MADRIPGGASAIVTGAASGIGLAVTERLLADGATVLAADVRGEGLDRLANLGAQTIQADLAVIAFLLSGEASYGTGEDVLVSAGLVS
jgi:NADP-dependent 3-hydroxy acid dehydrogenase YdfG